ncbi:MAG: hypothetical protein K2P35_09140 [Lachnospiraceae bacterium]|nr:hypothetical protein [Lachnospiraceae bacterium]NDO52065.1 hypothetical protein [Lachnospiraceae bacterium MD335]
MANICMDTVVFYAAFEEQESGLAALRQAVNDCYPVGTSVDDSRLCRIFEKNHIPMDGLSLRSNVVDTSLDEDGYITLYCDSAWSPVYEAYLCFADHFNVSFELQAEESGCGVYINTDINGVYLSTHYKACLLERPEDGFFDDIFDNAGGDTDLYFASEHAMLKWFKERGGIDADSVQALQDILGDGFVSIHEFVNPY